MSISKRLLAVAWTAGLIAVWILIALLTQPAAAAPPPGTQWVASGETIRTGRLPERLDLEGGFLLGAEMETAFANAAIADEILYVFDPATGTARPFDPVTRAPVALAGPLIALYSPTTGALEWATLDPMAGVPAILSPQTSPPAALGDWLGEAGSFAVLGAGLPRTTPVPEPGAALSLFIGAALLSRLGSARS